MGQSHTKKIIQIANSLKEKKILYQDQVQKFLEDLENDEPTLKQVKNFKDDNELQLFLKYFIPFHYTTTMTQQSQCIVATQENQSLENEIQKKTLQSIQKKFKNKQAIIKESFLQLKQAICQQFLNENKNWLKISFNQILQKMLGIHFFSYVGQVRGQKVLKCSSLISNSQSNQCNCKSLSQREFNLISQFNVTFNSHNSFSTIFENQSKQNQPFQNKYFLLTQIAILNNKFFLFTKHNHNLSSFSQNIFFLQQWKKFVSSLLSFTSNSIFQKQNDSFRKQRYEEYLNLCISSYKLQFLFLKENLKRKVLAKEICQIETISSIFNQCTNFLKSKKKKDLQKYKKKALRAIEQYQTSYSKILSKLETYKNEVIKNQQEMFIQINKYKEVTFVNLNIGKIFVNIKNKDINDLNCSDLSPYGQKIIDILNRYEGDSFNNQKLDFNQESFSLQTFFNHDQKLDQLYVRVPLKNKNKFQKYSLNQLKINKQPLFEITNSYFQQKSNINLIKIHSNICSQMDFHQIQKQILNPHFNAFNLSNNSFLTFILETLYQCKYALNIPQKNKIKLSNFLKKIQISYEQENNPFHNFRHGINVMQTSNLIINMSKNQKILSEFSKFTVILSALCHDVGHTGYSNAFQIATLSNKASMFNDISPLQNYHIFLTLSILKKEQNNFLDFLQVKQYAQFRKMLISNILYTDVKQHFNLIKLFQQHKSHQIFDQGSESQRIFCGMITHTSDFGGSAKQFMISQQWSKKVNEQFSKQSIRQKQLGLPLSPFMLNLDNPKILANNEYNFLKIIVHPLYKCLDQFFNVQNSQILLKHIESNMKKWQEILQNIQNDGNNEKSKA